MTLTFLIQTVKHVAVCCDKSLFGAGLRDLLSKYWAASCYDSVLKAFEIDISFLKFH